MTKAWGELDAVKLTNVYERWKLVLDLILKDDGGDQFIESNRSKLFRAPYQEIEELEEEELRHEVDAKSITAEEIDLINLELRSC